MAALALSPSSAAQPPPAATLVAEFMCIRSHEALPGMAGWEEDTGNGYFGGFQMDATFEAMYGEPYVEVWGPADNWPPSVQLAVAIRAYLDGRGFAPWPESAWLCGLYP